MSARLSRTLISARPPPRDEEMTSLGVRSLSRPAVTAERHARVATLGRVFHQGRSSFWTLRATHELDVAAELVRATGVAGRAATQVRRRLPNREVEALDERGVQGF